MENICLLVCVYCCFGNFIKILLQFQIILLESWVSPWQSWISSTILTSSRIIVASPSIGQSKTERCPSCLDFFQSERILTVASPFIVMYGDGGKLGDYPTKIKLKGVKKVVENRYCLIFYHMLVYGAEPRMDIIIHLFQNSTKGSGTITKYSTPIL